MTPSVTVVVPTIGRSSLATLLRSLQGLDTIVVDDRRRQTTPLATGGVPVRLLSTGGGRGPAAARNVGWRAARSEWVSFLDDDVEPSPGWAATLVRDLEALGSATAASQGRVVVPLPARRRPTDWERNVAGLADASWITADIAYRRAALELLGGFDERFRRAYREDADLALRAQRTGWNLTRGRRVVCHTVSPAPWWKSVASQRGNRDDVLMWRLHGDRWREEIGARRGEIRRHVFATSMLAIALWGIGGGTWRRVTAAMWLASTSAFAWRRIRPGPSDPTEITRMTVTSVAIPPAAVFWRIVGLVGDRRLAKLPRPEEAVEAVLFDRDGTLVVDVPYNGDPRRVTPVPGAKRVLDRLRKSGLRVGIVSNQSGIGRGLIDRREADQVMEVVDEILGPFDVIVYCPHVPDEQCPCRKPAPGLVVEAAHRMGVDPGRCVVVGDILSDVLAGEAAGARAVLVPNQATAPGERRAVTHVARDLDEAADLVLAWRKG